MREATYGNNKETGSDIETDSCKIVLAKYESRNNMFVFIVFKVIVWRRTATHIVWNTTTITHTHYKQQYVLWKQNLVFFETTHDF